MVQKDASMLEIQAWGSNRQGVHLLHSAELATGLSNFSSPSGKLDQGWHLLVHRVLLQMSERMLNSDRHSAVHRSEASDCESCCSWEGEGELITGTHGHQPPCQSFPPEYLQDRDLQIRHCHLSEPQISFHSISLK